MGIQPPSLAALLAALPASLLADGPGKQPGPEGPWQLGAEHRYVWLRGPEKVGETVFKIAEDLPPGGDRSEKPAAPPRFVLTATRTYDHQGNSQRARGKTTFLADGTPLAFEEELEVSALKNLRSSQVTSIQFASGKARVKYVNNRKEEQAILHEVEVPPGAYLFANQAVEHWALFASRFPPGADRHEVKLFYPDGGKVLEVVFKKAGVEKIKLGGDEIEATRYDFQSGLKEMSGSIWIDAERRLLQVEFANRPKDLALRVVIERRPGR